jgi:chaperonin GroEL
MKKYLSNEELHNSILKGVEKLYNYVSSTLGPCGHNVLIHLKDRFPISTKDGATVAKNMILDESFENMGLQIAKEAAIKSEAMSGDGTTSSTILAYSILKNAQSYLLSGCNPYDLQRGMEKCVEEIVKKLIENSKSISSKEDIEKVATLSANGDKTIGKIIADAINSIGKDGSIILENSNTSNTSLNLVEGFRLQSGYASPSFVTDERRGVVKYENPFVLVYNGKISITQDMMPVLEIAARENRSLIIVADSIEEQALAVLILNTSRGTLKVSAINAPKFGQERKNILKDLSLALGATLIGVESGVSLKNVKLEHLGTCKVAEIQKNNSIFIDGNANPQEIEKRIESLKNEILQTEDMDACQTIQERITRLSSGVAIIKIGGSSEIEVLEKRFRMDDALEAVRSAQQEGISPGGGIALIRIIKDIQVEVENEDQEFGVKIIKKAIKEPFKKLLTNANLNPDNILDKLEKESYEMVYDIRKKQVINMNDGVMDPTKVIRCALQNALSVAIALITTNHAIVDV